MSLLVILHRAPWSLIKTDECGWKDGGEGAVLKTGGERMADKGGGGGGGGRWLILLRRQMLPSARLH